MSSAYLAVIAALSGSAVGGVASIASAWLAQDHQTRAQWLQGDKGRREDLYKQFVEEASKLYADALSTDKTEVSALVGVYALISTMRFLSSEFVVEKADAVIEKILDTYSAPNKTVPELRQMMNRPEMDPLREFGEACREELRALRLR